ncbi:MAG TPA: L-threonylcarbamoyladenylate synthase [Actinomycetota bacterium]|nr:L-threonylcarbamoyladenylate synthase [Actinomycetota bacterium]
MTGRTPVDDAVDALARGALVAFPTDTVYGIAARPDLPGATDRLFGAKRRPRSLTLPILVADVATARLVGALDATAERAAATWWPGPVTLIVPRTDRSRGWDLGDRRDTVGIRVPDEPLALELLRRTGPLAVTSANRTGEDPGRTCDELVATFGADVDVYLCSDEALIGVASSVVDLTTSPARLLREGTVSAEAVRRFMDGGDPLLDSGPLR